MSCTGFAYPPSANRFDEQRCSINGRVFNNVGGLEMNIGENVRWYVAGMGDALDAHTPHWHAQTVTSQGVRSDVLQLLPADMLEADMVPGSALLGCVCAKKPGERGGLQRV